MKKNFLFLLLAIFYVNLSFSQLVQASLGTGTTPNSVKIYIKPAVSQSPANISTLQFNLAVSSTITPKPTITVVSTTLAGVTWQVNEAPEGGYYNYQIFTSSTPLNPTVVANTDFEVLEVKFSGGPATANNVSLVTLPDGGVGLSGGNSLFLSTGSLKSDGSNLYYTRSGVTVNNQNSYDEDGLLPGLLTSTATITGILLPLKWLSFSAVKQNGKAVVNWEVANQLNNDYFEVEVSNDGRSFASIGKVPVGEKNGYSFTDANLSKVEGSYAYYRIKQVDKDGKSTYSDIRKLLLTGKDFAFNIIGNPVIGNVLNIGVQSPASSSGVITIIDLNGKKLFSGNITFASGYSQHAVNIPFLPAGTYTANLTTGSNKYQVKFVK